MNLRTLADLNRRLAISFIAIAVVGLLIAYSARPIAGYFVLLTVALLSAVGVWEYANLAKQKGFKPASVLMVTAALGEAAAFFLVHLQGMFFSLPAALLVASAILFLLYHFSEASGSVANVAVEFFGLCYVAVPIGFFLGILYPNLPGATPQMGRWWLVYLIFVTKMADVSAYFVGRLWGKRALAPTLSPNKTVEGAIAGFACAVGVSLGMYALGHAFSRGAFVPTLYEALGLGVLIGIFGQLGDLAESLLKRDAMVKDSNVMPGLGGVLDMVDSLLLTAPIVYFFLSMQR